MTWGQTFIYLALFVGLFAALATAMRLIFAPTGAG